MKRTDSDAAVPDGGNLEETDLFTRTADVRERTRAEKLYWQYDILIATPFRVAWSDLRMRVGSIIIIGFVLMSTVGVMYTDPPVVMQTKQFLSPFQSVAHPLGGDDMGRDMFRQIIHSSPAMAKMILAGSLLSVGVGTLFGTTAGYVGGWIDRVLVVITDTVLTIPALPLIIILATVWQPRDPFLVGIMLGIDNWPGLSRTLRAQVLSLREEEFIESARAMGLSKPTILRRYLITNLAPYILVNMASSARSVIFESVALYYLAILPFTSLNWGVMLNTAYQSGFITDPGKIHWLLVPMITIIIVSMGFMLVAQGMDRVFNVRLRAKHAKTRSDEGDAELG